MGTAPAPELPAGTILIQVPERRWEDMIVDADWATDARVGFESGDTGRTDRTVTQVDVGLGWLHRAARSTEFLRTTGQNL